MHLRLSSVSTPKLYVTSLTIIAILVVPSIVVHYAYSQTPGTGISILSSSPFTDDIGYYHVVGEVKNNSPTDSMN
jgi:hypothetical protein